MVIYYKRSTIINSFLAIAYLFVLPNGSVLDKRPTHSTDKVIRRLIGDNIVAWVHLPTFFEHVLEETFPIDYLSDELIPEFLSPTPIHASYPRSSPSTLKKEVQTFICDARY